MAPHHLFLTENSVHDATGKVNPPVRTQEDCDALWDALRDGTLDFLGSDHAPHTWKEKQGSCCPSGIAGVETTLPLMLDAVRKGKLTLTDLQRIGAENAAHIFGLKNKGKIAEGYDADLVLVDMEMHRSITSLDFQSLAKFSPFNGCPCTGWPIATFVGGKLAWEREDNVFYSANGKEVDYY